MVWVGPLFMNRGSEPTEPVVELTGERDRDVRRSEGRNHLEACVLQVSNAIDPNNREPPQRSRAEVVDIGVALRVQRGEPPSVPVRETATEPFRLESRVVIDEFLASHDDDRVGW